jgi:hypothetical protein
MSVKNLLKPVMLAQMIMHLTYIQEVPILNLGWNTSYPEVSHGSYFSCWADVRRLPEI